MDQPLRSIHDRIMSPRLVPAAPQMAVGDRREPPVRRRRRPSKLPYFLAGLLVLAIAAYGLTWLPAGIEWLARITGALDRVATSTPVAATQSQPAQPVQTAQPAQPVQTAQQVQPLQQQPPAGQSATADQNIFAKHAADAGMRTCAATYAQLGESLTAGSQYMLQTEVGRNDPDRQAAQGLVGLLYNGDKGFTGQAGGMVFVAPTANGCEGAMTRIVPFPQDCQAAAAMLPQGSTQLPSLAGIPMFQLGTGGQALLISSGQGCVAISVVRSGG